MQEEPATGPADDSAYRVKVAPAAGAVAAGTSTIAVTAIVNRAFGKEISVGASTLLAIVVTIVLLLSLSFCSLLAMAA